MRTMGWLLVVACSGNTSPPIDAGMMDVRTTPCWADLRTTTNRMCSVNGDCAVLDQQVDCCGSIVEVGVRLDQVDTLHNAEIANDTGCPACGCPPKPTVDETGNSGGAFVASCDMGLCTAHTQ